MKNMKHIKQKIVIGFVIISFISFALISGKIIRKEILKKDSILKPKDDSILSRSKYPLDKKRLREMSDDDLRKCLIELKSQE
jgi:hypothetical protein